MRAVNLLTYDAGFAVSGPRLRLPKTGLPVAAALVGALAFGFVGLSYTGARADVAALSDDLDAVRVEQAALEAQLPKGDPAALAERQQRESALATALGHRVAFENLLGDVGYVLPREVLLTQLHVETPTSPIAAVAGGATESGTAAPSGFMITGIAPSQRSVARALRRLALVPGLTDVRLQSSVAEAKDGRNTTTFTATASVRKKEGATS